MTVLAEIIVRAAFDLSQKSLASRYGEVKDVDGESCNFAIVGLGKLGGEEMTYHSDLDLIFIHSGEGATTGPSVTGAQEYWIKIIQRLISCLSTITRTGFAYKLDTRLRPSGNAGVLVSSLDTYLNYHDNSEPWEHQALIKARVVGGSGSSEWYQEVKDVIHRAVYEWHPPSDLNARIHHLRQRKEKELSRESKHLRNIKEGRGGLLDVEYLTQALQLKHGRLCPQLQNTKTMEALRELGRNSIIKQQESKVLQKNYIFLRLIENGLRLIYDDSTNLLDFKRVQENTILQLLKLQGYSVKNLREAVESATIEIREIYLNYF
jgi:glutamate-ammonia-ligase adenylyltransferase